MDKYKRLVSNTMLFAISTFSSKLLSFVMAPAILGQIESQGLRKQLPFCFGSGFTAC